MCISHTVLTLKDFKIGTEKMAQWEKTLATEPEVARAAPEHKW